VIDLPATLGGALEVVGAEARAFRLEVAALRERAEAAVEAMRPGDDVVPPATLVVTWPDDDDPTAPAEIDRPLRQAVSPPVSLSSADATELLARLEGRSPSKLDPPDDDTRDAVDDIERAVVGAITGLTETPASQLSEAILGQTNQADFPVRALPPRARARPQAACNSRPGAWRAVARFSRPATALRQVPPHPQSHPSRARPSTSRRSSAGRSMRLLRVRR